jgi:hypothetical protein
MARRASACLEGSCAGKQKERDSRYIIYNTEQITPLLGAFMSFVGYSRVIRNLALLCPNSYAIGRRGAL